ncbi:MAG: hypothetical protein CMIDDMOC_00910 [Sodalis sp. Fle]|nr:MAG: hypothetical protein CMIDDMOC_00910 [Sodalis sp. Fle]
MGKDREKHFSYQDLDCDTLLPLWQQCELLLSEIRILDVSGLKWVDYAGMAMMCIFIISSVSTTVFRLAARQWADVNCFV